MKVSAWGWGRRAHVPHPIFAWNIQDGPTEKVQINFEESADGEETAIILSAHADLHTNGNYTVSVRINAAEAAALAYLASLPSAEREGALRRFPRRKQRRRAS